MERIRIGVLGASGYTGAELLRLLLNHPAAEIRFLTADRQAGQPLSAVFPQFAPVTGLPDLLRIEDADLAGVDLIFCCLPHGTTQEVIAGLPEAVRVIDLSADFRLSDPAVYAEWYGHEHRAPELQRSAVYGLTEIKREEIRGARLVANPGCYTTTAQLPLRPLLQADLIEREGIVIDGKSGQSGAGRGLKQGMLFAEVAEGMHAYGLGGHRHLPEIEQGLSESAGEPVACTFTAHLVPMNRGILTTIYARARDDVEALHRHLAAFYRDEAFVDVLPYREAPQTRHVRGTNLCRIGVVPDRIAGLAVLVAVTDNLVKGASGQAVQNMNLMFGRPETTGLPRVAVFP